MSNIIDDFILLPSLEGQVFERLREAPSELWQKIHASEFFKIAFQTAVGIAVTIVYVAIVLPVSLILTAISAIGFLALGLFSPALVHPHTAKIWRMVKNKLFGLVTDLIRIHKALLITPYAFEANASRNQSKNINPLIVFPHGFLHNKTCSSNLEKELQKETKNSLNPITGKDIYAINFGEPLTLKKIEYYSRFLATKLQQIRKERNLEKLDVIFDCHSMGGLVAGHFAVNYASTVGVNVLRLIANGTPWHGTPVAYIAPWAACGIEMFPGSFFQTTLAAQIKGSEIKDRIYTIASEGDTIVPYQSALGSELGLSADRQQFTLGFSHGHLAMLEADDAIETNIRWITEVWNKQ